MLNRLVFLILVILISQPGFAAAFNKDIDSSQVIVKKTADFTITGDGKAPSWATTKWVTISVQESAGGTINTKAKILYSGTGIYILFWCEDQKLTATIEEDFKALYKEDVVEVFLWPDQAVPVYFEYEVSPLNYELPLMIINLEGKFSGWHPSNYSGKRKIQHATSVQGGEKKSNAPVKSWMAEMFIPYELLRPLVKGTPQPGTKWRANLYRIDYDKGYTTATWQKTTPNKPANFHDFNRFGTFIFE